MVSLASTDSGKLSLLIGSPNNAFSNHGYGYHTISHPQHTVVMLFGTHRVSAAARCNCKKKALRHVSEPRRSLSHLAFVLVGVVESTAATVVAGCR